MIRHVIDSLLPARCLLCRQPARRNLALCEHCHRQLPLNSGSCQQCARPLQINDITCGRCQQHPPHYDRTTAPLQYRDGVRQLILELKFQEKIRNARLLANLFHAHLPDKPLPEVLVPVPLHARRMKERGYNQSLELARELRRLSGIRVDNQAAHRNRNTLRQADLPLADRRANIKNAFEVSNDLECEHIAIIDDVMTSGHTVDELARLFKQAGVKRVDVWVMARAG